MSAFWPPRNPLILMGPQWTPADLKAFADASAEGRLPAGLPSSRSREV
jgi:hypothetical protein